MEKKNIPYVSAGILIINLAVFIITEMIFAAGEYGELLKICALNVDSFFRDNNYYCLITHMFMHVGVEHIAYNMLVLVSAGYYIEKEIGRINYFVIYMTSGIFSGFMSMLWDMFATGEHTVSIGASGAVYGITGVFLAFVFSDKRRFEEFGIVRVCLFLFLSLYCTSLQENINYVAHIAGFIYGFIAACIVIYIKKSARKGNVRSED